MYTHIYTPFSCDVIAFKTLRETVSNLFPRICTGLALIYLRDFYLNLLIRAEMIIVVVERNAAKH